MADDTEIPPTPSFNEDQDLPKATLLPSDSLSNPSIKTWKYDNLSAQEQHEDFKLREEVIERLREEVAPQVKEQTILIKKHAFEEAQKQGYEEGFQQGVKAGRLEGKSVAQKEAEDRLEPQVKSLQDLAEFMCNPYQRISEQVFTQLAALSIEISKKIVEKEIEHHRSWVLDAVKKAVESLPNEVDAIEVYLNPSDKEIIEEYATDKRTNWVLVADDNVLPGSCKVKQESSTLVNDWREQLATLVAETYAMSEKLATEAENTVVDPNTSKNKSDSSDVIASQ